MPKFLNIQMVDDNVSTPEMVDLSEYKVAVYNGEKESPSVEKYATMGEVSDGYHTFDELYHHRAVLFACICNAHPIIAWKSKLHYDPENNPMYEGMFICGISTADGEATYHYDMKYWDMFKVKELPTAPMWDGSTPDECIARLANFAKAVSE